MFPVLVTLISDQFLFDTFQKVQIIICSNVYLDVKHSEIEGFIKNRKI